MNTTALPIGGGDSTDSANKLALAAAILAAAAFVVAFAQTILAYTSSSDSRNKCTNSAIDVSSRQVKFGWHWRLWKLRVYYPLLDFSYSKILFLQLKSSLESIDSSSSPLESVRKKHRWNWMSVEEKDLINRSSVADPFTKMVAEDGIVTTKNLTWRECATFYIWKIRHPFHYVIRPRASWAQMLLALGIRDTSSITYRYADADLIPSSFDVPIQRVKLYDLGILALLLGFKSVRINVDERTFEAVGQFGTITTILSSDIGKFLRFEGDIFAINAQISKGDPRILISYARLVNGKLPMGPDYVMNGYFSPLQLLPVAVTESWDEDKFDTEQAEAVVSSIKGHGFTMGQVGAEAALFAELYEYSLKNDRPRPVGQNKSSTPTDNEDILQMVKSQRTSTGLSAKQFDLLMDQKSLDDAHVFKAACSKWQGATDQRLPTILAAATMTLLGSAAIGFPSRILIDPFLPWIKSLADDLILRNPDHIHVSQTLLSGFKMNRLSFVRARDAFWLSFDYVGLSNLDRHCGWIYHEIKEVYDCCEEDLQKEILPCDDDGKCTGEVKAVLFPDAFTLLRNFSPKDWTVTIENILIFSPVKFRPVNMLWTQVVLLDISIHYLIRGGWHTGPINDYKLWSKQTIAVINALVESWSNGRYPVKPTPMPTPTPTPTAPAPTATDDAAPSATAPNSPPEANDSAPQEQPTPPSPSHPPPSPSHPPSTPSPPPPPEPLSQTSHTEWDLASYLSKQPDLIFSEADPEVQKRKIGHLADLLQLRALFFIAFLQLNPDSSDVYLAEGSEVEMPMV